MHPPKSYTPSFGYCCPHTVATLGPSSSPRTRPSCPRPSGPRGPRAAKSGEKWRLPRQTYTIGTVCLENVSPSYRPRISRHGDGLVSQDLHKQIRAFTRSHFTVQFSGVPKQKQFHFAVTHLASAFMRSVWQIPDFGIRCHLIPRWAIDSWAWRHWASSTWHEFLSWPLAPIPGRIRGPPWTLTECNGANLGSLGHFYAQKFTGEMAGELSRHPVWRTRWPVKVRMLSCGFSVRARCARAHFRRPSAWNPASVRASSKKQPFSRLAGCMWCATQFPVAALLIAIRLLFECANLAQSSALQTTTLSPVS